MVGRRRVAAFLLLLASAAYAAEEKPAPARPLPTKNLGEAARLLAKKGRAAEVEEIFDLLRSLGAPTEETDRLRKACNEALPKGKAPAGPVPEAGKALRKSAEEIAAALGSLDGDRRRAAAMAVLRLDAGVVPAHEALGHIRHRDGWLPARLEGAWKRRAEILRLRQEARSVEVKFTEEPSTLPLFPKLYGGKAGILVRAGNVSVHSASLTAAKMERILRETLRACAFAEGLRTGTTAVPALGKRDFVFLASQAKYLEAVREAAAAGGLTKEWADAAPAMGGFIDGRKWVVFGELLESDLEGTLIKQLFRDMHGDLTGGDPQPTLMAAHLGWVCRTYLGTDFPLEVWLETEEEKRSRGGSRTSGGPVVEAERKEFIRLAAGGMPGVREWMAWLVRRGEDPPLTRCVKDQMGKIVDDELFKVLSLGEFLHETGDLYPFMEKSTGKPFTAAGLGEGIGEPVPALDERWKEWITFVCPVPCLADRVEGKAPSRDDPRARPVLDHLNRIRKAALVDSGTDPNVGADRGLSEGAAAHARYLAANPDQAARWPDAHEEFPDRPGYSVEGAWAGGHSVIAPGAKDGPGAVDSWMGTYFHRLPLLSPGLLRIGWGHEGGVAVLDADSLSVPDPQKLRVYWPPKDARQVPLSFVPELPNPFPGEDQSKWGYPITVQVFGTFDGLDMELTLSEGAMASGLPVPCLLSSPMKPGNIELVPRSAWCLIPCARLKPRTFYSVTAREPGGGTTTWKFQTGDR